MIGTVLKPFIPQVLKVLRPKEMELTDFMNAVPLEDGESEVVFFITKQNSELYGLMATIGDIDLNDIKVMVVKRQIPINGKRAYKIRELLETILKSI